MATPLIPTEPKPEVTGKSEARDLHRPEFARDDGKAVEHVRRRYSDMAAMKSRYTQRNNFHYSLWRSYSKPRSYPHSKIPRANVFVPYSFATIENMVPRIVKAVLMDGYNFFDLYPRERADRRNALKHKKLIQWQIEQANFWVEFVAFVKQAAMYGYSAAKIDWRFEKGNKRVLRIRNKYMKEVLDEQLREKYGHALYEEVLEKNHIIHDNPQFSVIDWDDFYVSPSAKYTLHSAYDCLMVSRVPLRTLKRRVGPDGKSLYKNLDKIAFGPVGQVGSQGKSGPTYSEESAQKDRRLATIGASKEIHRTTAQVEHDREAQEVSIHEYWTRDWCITIANKDTCIRRRPNPFWHGQLPFVDLPWTITPNEIYSPGCIENIRDLQLALNSISNLQLDNWSMTVNQSFVASRDADISQEQLVSRPWGVIYVNGDVNKALRPLQRQSVMGETAQMQSEYRANIQIASGLSDIHYLGASGGGAAARTATGVLAAEKESNLRFQMIVELAEKMAVVPTIKMFASLNNQFLRTPKMVRVLGEDAPTQVLPEEIWGEVDCMTKGASRLMEQEASRASIINIARVIGNAPMFMEHVKIREFVYQLLDRFDFNPEELLKPGPESHIDPATENRRMYWGERMSPHADEDLKAHMESHLRVRSDPHFENWPEQSKLLLMEHIQETQRLMELMAGTGGGLDVGSAVQGAEMMAGQGGMPGQEAMMAAAMEREGGGYGPNAQNAGGRNQDVTTDQMMHPGGGNTPPFYG